MVPQPLTFCFVRNPLLEEPDMTSYALSIRVTVSSPNRAAQIRILCGFTIFPSFISGEPSW